MGFLPFPVDGMSVSFPVLVNCLGRDQGLQSMADRPFSFSVRREMMTCLTQHLMTRPRIHRHKEGPHVSGPLWVKCLESLGSQNKHGRFL